MAGKAEETAAEAWKAVFFRCNNINGIGCDVAPGTGSKKSEEMMLAIWEYFKDNGMFELSKKEIMEEAKKTDSPDDIRYLAMLYGYKEPKELKQPAEAENTIDQAGCGSGHS